MVLAAHSESEQPTIAAIQAGDRLAFEGFVRRHNRWVRGIIFGVLGDADRVDDAAQQVWQSVWSRLGELRDQSQWRPWLYRLARNAALDAGRSESRRKRLIQEGAAESDSGSPTAAAAPDRQIMDQERRQAVLEAIRSLPALYREPFVLRHMEDWSYQQIAETMNLPPATVETRLARARRLLREALCDEV